ncbi:hypothetical protein P6166_12235 [Stenotrophomonas sp. HITSZ_GD]|uniref:hypothetical protein n=1 Tax=Stenotrophomonas sp. HITSZ_GD TaxID=3037248 RepID=UPI00240E8527|nr:hypothetical protein [Stenotrophomonas sp. HITSZ_GD]MDG2526124.1 hypothetical protein [Stenotrophomonas sp. HITSZ_GD]
MTLRPLRPRWNALPRWLRGSLLAVVSLYLLYLLAANLFLNTGLAPWAINRKPERFTLHWDRAVSWWPGRVDVHGVRLRGHVMHVRWHIDAARARGQIALLPLLRREVHMPTIEADEVTGGTRRDDGPPIEPQAPIPGHPGWLLRFDRIHSDSVRGGQFGDLRLDGSGSAQFGFYKRLRSGPMRIYPSWGHIGQVRLRMGEHEWLREGRLDADFSMDPHTRAQAQGVQKLDKTLIRLRLLGNTTGLALQRDSRGRPVFRAATGTGKADIDARWVRGELAPGSRAQWTAPLLGVDPTGQPLPGELDVRLNVDQDLHVQAKVPGAAPDALWLDADLRFAGRRVPVRDFASLVPRASGHVQGRWRFASLDWITGLFPRAKWLQLRGEGTVDADVQVRAGQLAAGSHVRVPDVAASAQVMATRFQGSASADLHVEAAEDGTQLPTLAMQMQRFVLAALDAPDKPYVEGNDLRLTLRTLPGKPSAAHLRQTTQGHLVFRDARVPDLRAYNRYLPQQQLRFEGGSGRASGDLQLLPGGDIGEGRVQVQAQAAQLSAAGIAFRGDVAADLQLRHGELKERNFSLDTSVIELRNVSFTGNDGRERGGWWARAVIDRGRTDWTPPVLFDADVRLDMRDVGFVMALYAQKRDFPKWIDNLVDAGETKMAGRVHWQDDQLLLDNFKASNDRFDVLARLRLHDKRQDGSLYAKWGLLSAALELRDGQRQWHLLKARQWYDEQPPLLEAAPK